MYYIILYYIILYYIILYDIILHYMILYIIFPLSQYFEVESPMPVNSHLEVYYLKRDLKTMTEPEGKTNSKTAKQQK